MPISTAFASAAPMAPSLLNTRRLCTRPLTLTTTPRRSRLSRATILAVVKPAGTVRQTVQWTERSVAAGVPKDAVLYAFECDAGGNEISGSAEILSEVATGKYDDVIVVSHGWNISKENGKIAFNHNLIRAMMGADPKKGERKVLFVGVCWPSHPSTIILAPTEEGEEGYVKGVADAVRKIANDVGVEKTEESLKGLNIDYKKKADEMNAKRENDPIGYWSGVKKSLEVTDADAAQSLGQIIEAFESGDLDVDASTGKIGGGMMAKVENFANSLDKSPGDGDGSELDGDEEVDAAAIGAGSKHKVGERAADKESFVIKTIWALIGPLLSALGVGRPGRSMIAKGAISTALERIFFGKFQKRASDVGSRGVHLLMSKMMRVVPEGANTKFHLVGHSLGCHVVTSAAIGRSPETLLPRKLHSLTLLQAAVPFVTYSEGRPYRPLSGLLRPVAGPVIATTSESDMALYNMEMFNSTVVGRGGWEGLSAPTKEVVLQNDVEAKLGFKKGTFYTVRADSVINETSGLLYVDLDGAHGDLLDYELQSRVWEAIDTPVEAEDLNMPSKSDLPEGYWSTDRVVRRRA